VPQTFFTSVTREIPSSSYILLFLVMSTPSLINLLQVSMINFVLLVFLFNITYLSINIINWFIAKNQKVFWNFSRKFFTKKHKLILHTENYLIPIFLYTWCIQMWYLKAFWKSCAKKIRVVSLARARRRVHWVSEGSQRGALEGPFRGPGPVGGRTCISLRNRCIIKHKEGQEPRGGSTGWSGFNRSPPSSSLTL